MAKNPVGHRAARWLVVVCLAAASAAPASMAAPRTDLASVIAVAQSARHASSFGSFIEAKQWIDLQLGRTRDWFGDVFYGAELLRVVHREAVDNGLEPSLVLGLIEVESTFRDRAVSVTGARGLMQIKPFWIKEIGIPGDDLFHPFVNVRYGCRILRYYVDLSRGNVTEALARYNGTYGSDIYPDKVKAASRRYNANPDVLLTAN